MPRLLASFALGLGVPLAFAPFAAWWLLPPLVAAMTWLWLGEPPRRAFRIGFAFGSGAFLAGTYWLYHSIYIIGQTPLALALFLMLGLVAIMALYYGGVAAAVSWLAAGSPGRALLVLAPVWVVSEWLRGWVLSGFPWLSLGYALPESLLAGWLPVLGVYGGSLVLVTLAVSLLLLAQQQRRLRVAGALVALGTGVASAALHERQYVVVEPRAISVAIGQLGLDQSLKWDQEKFQSTLAWYARFVADARGADLLVMPEVAVPTVAGNVGGYLAQLEQAARSGGSTLMLGILRDHPQGGPSNALLVLGDGQRQWYEKRHLVPFGEFFPVPSFVREWMRLRGLPYADISPGPARQPALNAAGTSVAPSICYEDAYASEQLDFFPQAGLIVNVSNDAWFGDSIAPHQHLQIARTRSAESQRWQARSTNNGITALIDGGGRVVARVPAFEPAVLSGSVRIVAGATPFIRWGHWPVLLLAAAVIAFAAVRRRYNG